MNLSKLLIASAVAVTPVVAWAQDTSGNGRGSGGRAVGPASENGDTATGQTSIPGAMTGRSANPGGQGTNDYDPPAMNPNAPGSSRSPGMGGAAGGMSGAAGAGGGAAGGR
ncbi:hypothetical protein [Methylocapsa palsarum]|uniref:Uncharacterized protein n=1 Tax=Methylocapsa palsarum TaxID=1612308 RepID=A0A1I3WYR2_9HYPH|nr:hypothetical protein [Methylocapsa palsarum]SFK12605.1 hypothetical protein SAMN05444581_102245 [Methylocapsa palsarum]